MWPKRSKKILVVEDEDLVRRMLVRFLTKEGHEVREAVGVEDALPIYEAGRPFHALLCDIELGADSGWGVALSVRAFQPSIGVLMLTGRLQGTPPPEGFRHYLLEKPFTQSQLNSALSKLW